MKGEKKNYACKVHKLRFFKFHLEESASGFFPQISLIVWAFLVGESVWEGHGF